MTQKHIKLMLLVAVVIILGSLYFTELPLSPFSLFWSKSGSNTIPTVPVKDMVTMVDLGAKTCIPCKMMAPILDELEQEYKGRATIRFIDVWEHKDQAQKFNIRAIPTQIFFDKNGKEVERHTGFLDKQSIVEKLKNLGVNNVSSK